MFVLKRDGRREPVGFDKIQKRIQFLVNEPSLLDEIDVGDFCLCVIKALSSGMKTSDIDEFAARTAADRITISEQYGVLASRIAVNNMHKTTMKSFIDKTKALYYREDEDGKLCPLVDNKYYKFVRNNSDRIESIINYDRDYLLDYMGLMTFISGEYINKIGPENNKKLIERPQDCFMRVAIYINMFNVESYEFSNCSPISENLDDVFYRIADVYNCLSLHLYTQATPTLLNAGLITGQLASCFLLGSEDSQIGILDTQREASILSKSGGGIGFYCGDWRAKGTLIRSTNGPSGGPVPFLRIFNNSALAFNQGGKRPGSWVAYMEPHHPDILDFLSLRKQEGDEESRTKDLFLGLWISDLFMKRAKSTSKEMWSLFCPDRCPELSNLWGDEYEKMYLKYEKEKKYVKQVPVEEILYAIYVSQKETGLPYCCFKDNSNKVSTQSNIGVIKNSNLCAEIYEFSSKDETAVCNLASICLPKCVKDRHSPALMEYLDYFEKYFTGCTYSTNDTYNTNDTNNTDGKNDKNETKNKLDELYKKLPVKGECVDCDVYWNNKSELDGLNLEGIKTIKKKLRKLNHEFPIYPYFDFKLLVELAMKVTENNNRVLDVNNYPTVKSARSNFKHRPIGVGLQGLADTFLKMGLAFDSKNPEEAKKVNLLNEMIQASIYYGCMSKSVDLSRDIYIKIKNKFKSLLSSETKELSGENSINLNSINSINLTTSTYPKHIIEKFPELEKENEKHTYNFDNIPTTIGAYPSYFMNGGSPMSKGKFHWELGEYEPSAEVIKMFDWESLREKMLKFGIRNSCTTANMPTGSTSQIMGNSPCFEPYFSNVYVKKGGSGCITMINKYLYRELKQRGLWDKSIVNFMNSSQGSIQNIEGMPEDIKNKYKTSWEVRQKTILNYAISRQPFCDQGQSMNLFFEVFTYKKFFNSLVYSWKHQLKTGNYYVKTRSGVEAQKFTLNKEDREQIKRMTATAAKPIEAPEDLCPTKIIM